MMVVNNFWSTPVSNFKSACTASWAGRGLRLLIALFIAAFALASIETPLVAILGGIASLYVLFLAITGWCPGSATDPLAIDLTSPEDGQ